MSDKDRNEAESVALEVAIMQWSLVLIDTLLEDRPTDREWCLRDLLNAD